MALYESFTFRPRKSLASFVGLASPHAEHGIATSLPEAVDHSGMVLEMAIQSGPRSRKRIPMIANFPPVRAPQRAAVLNYAIRQLSSGLVLTTKVGHGAPQTSPRAKETITATAMMSNRRMFSTRSPVHKGKTTDQNDCNGDQQYDHGSKVSLVGPIEGSPQVEKPSITRHPPYWGVSQRVRWPQIGMVRGKEVHRWSWPAPRLAAFTPQQPS